MQIPINTAPLKALDVPTRWLLATALSEASTLAELVHRGEYGEPDPVTRAEAVRKRDAYREIARAIRD